jgi:formamidopyrimidine-DNA glycosylase
MEGRRIESVSRRGKYLVLRLHGNRHLVVHLKMSGSLVLKNQGERPEPAARAIFALADGRRLCFNDTRKFGELHAVRDPRDIPGFARLGPEPLASGFSKVELRRRLKGRRSRIKALLLDQRFLAGVGNIYASEALHVAGIRPGRRACSLSRREAEALYRSLRRVLRRAIELQGTSIDGFYRDASGRPGRFSEELAVYGRVGEECHSCGTVIRKISLGGRGTFFCPCCQR